MRRCFSLALGLVVLLAACDRGSRPARIGTSAPEFTVRDSDRTVSLHEFRGKTVVLNFWATWCPPCLEEVPSLVEMQKRMGDRITVVAVSVDEDEDAYHRFLRDYKVDLLTVRDPRQTSNRLYGTFGYPETYVIDGGGVVRRKFVGPVDWVSPEVLDYLAKVSAADHAPTREAAR
jgi:cytochrome c biogenesis protein CcmG, thiol:disulfide interchange protein DsbE